jgi:hypothetical protein
MKRTFATLLAGLLLATAQPTLALARDNHHRDRDRQPHGWQNHDRGHERQRHQRHDGYSSALGWGLAGLALGGIVFSAGTPTPPVIIAPTPVRPPGSIWYYCDTYAAYYPYVDQCPGGWRAVPAY